MESLSPTATGAPPETLSERIERELERKSNIVDMRRAGDTFEQGGWQHHSPYLVEAPEPPSRFLILLPYIVLFVVAVALTIGLILIGGQS